MLGSITPLGERGRGSTWWVTVSAYIAGSAVGAAALGAALGGIGARVAPSATVEVRLALLGSIVAVGIAFDAGDRKSTRLNSSH